MNEPADEPPPGVKPVGCPSGGKQEEPGPFELEGECIEIGDDDNGQPRLIIHTTREEIMRGARGFAYQKVKVTLCP